MVGSRAPAKGLLSRCPKLEVLSLGTRSRVWFRLNIIRVGMLIFMYLKSHEPFLDGVERSDSINKILFQQK